MDKPLENTGRSLFLMLLCKAKCREKLIHQRDHVAYVHVFKVQLISSHR